MSASVISLLSRAQPVLHHFFFSSILINKPKYSRVESWFVEICISVSISDHLWWFDFFWFIEYIQKLFSTHSNYTQQYILLHHCFKWKLLLELMLLCLFNLATMQISFFSTIIQFTNDFAMSKLNDEFLTEQLYKDVREHGIPCFKQLSYRFKQICLFRLCCRLSHPENYFNLIKS